MGCCSSRSVDNGTPGWSEKEENVKKVKDALAAAYKSEDFETFSKEGWRLHHSFKEGDKSRTWLSVALRGDKKNIFESQFLTVDEASLVEENNFEIFFANEAYLKQLEKNYKENGGFKVTNADLIKAFEKAESKSTDADLYKNLRVYLELASKEIVAVVEDKKTEITKEVPKDIVAES